MTKIYQYLKENYLLVSILVLGAILRFYHINYQSIWLDELHTIIETNPKNPLSALADNVAAGEQIPPLYFYTVYFIFKIFGYSSLVMRVYSAVLGIVSLYALYALGKETVSKKVGLASAFLLAINGFHIYYSQEARPYILLLLFSILSFYWLVRFLKIPTLKNAIFYGVFAGLMLNAHFFALFALASQYFILLFFLVVSEKANRKKFFIYAFASGLISLILFLPNIKTLISASEITKFWAPQPTWDSYTLIFKEFFGNSEELMAVIGVLLIFYFIKLALEKELPLRYNDIIKSKTIFSFVLIAPWLVIVILIPLIRSYLSAPMLISRYFILLLPAILLVLAIALFQFKNSIVRNTLLSVLLIFSLTDILVVKKYYQRIIKTQFREVTTYIIENNKKNDPVVTSLPWHLSHFLVNDTLKTNVVDNTLDNWVDEMRQDSTKIKSFWYADGHQKPYTLSKDREDFLAEHFVMEDNIEGFDCYARHYQVGKNKITTFDISKFKPLELHNGDPFTSNIEKFEFANNILKVAGFAFFDQQSAANSKYNVLLIKDGVAYKLSLRKILRPDVTIYYKVEFDVSNSGFDVDQDISSIPPGTYQLALYVFNADTKKEGLMVTDKTINKP